MTKKIFLSGNEDDFSQALADRLQRAGAILTQSSDDAEYVIHFGHESIGNMAIVPFHKETNHPGLVVVIHDLLSPEGNSTHWGDEELHGWANEIREGTLDFDSLRNFSPRYWVHVRDVCDALCTLILSDIAKSIIGRLNISGRRPWGPQSIVEEMRMLWGRYEDSVNYSHTVESLSTVPSPVSHEIMIETKRPDLSLLHKLLIKCESEGWHPLVPMRVSLMEILAHAKD